MTTEIETSQQLRLLKTSSVAIVSIILIIVIALIFSNLRSFLGLHRGSASLIFWIFVIVLAVSATILTWLEDDFTKYRLKDGQLIKYSNFFGHTSNLQIITTKPSNISKLNLNQSFLGKQLGYGTICLEITKYGISKKYSISGVDQPKQVFELLEKQLLPK